MWDDCVYIYIYIFIGCCTYFNYIELSDEFAAVKSAGSRSRYLGEGGKENKQIFPFWVELHFNLLQNLQTKFVEHLQICVAFIQQMSSKKTPIRQDN